MDAKAVRLELEGTAPLVMEVHRLRFERGPGGRVVPAPEPVGPGATAADYLSLDRDGNPCIGWAELVHRLVARPGEWIDLETIRRDCGLDVEGGRLSVLGEWRPREVVRRGVAGPWSTFLPTFDAWRACGTLLYEPSLWTEDGLREALGRAGEGSFVVAAWEPAGKAVAA